MRFHSLSVVLSACLLLTCAAGGALSDLPQYADTIIAGRTFTGKCTAVFDGDTVRILKAGRAVTVRIEGIDCPESGQDYSALARRFTSSLVYGKIVQVKEKEIDDYGRIVARISVAGQDVSLALVTAGLAWHYRYFSSDRTLAEAEKEARAARRGLWSMPNPVAPWNYRRRKRRETPLTPHEHELLGKDELTPPERVIESILEGHSQ